MKRSVRIILSGSVIMLAVSACGGGGGGGSAPPAVPTTKAVLSAYLFGTMSSSSAMVGSVDVSMKVPSGIFVDYSSPAPFGSPANTFPLRSGSIVPSGPLLNSSAMTSGSYNTQSGMLQFSILNTPASNNSMATLRGGINGNGIEFAKLYFKLATADANVSFQPANQSLTYAIKQTDLISQTSGVPAHGCELKFSTTYQ